MSCSQSCNQGRNCTCRQACELPIDQDKQRTWPYRLADLLMVLFLVGFVCWLLGVFGPALDAHSQTDAEKKAQTEFRKELAEAKMCRETVGESLIRHTADGQTVCVPRGYIHRKNQVASR